MGSIEISEDLTLEEILQEIEKVQAKIKAHQYYLEPTFWVEDKLGEKIWSGQKKIMNSVRDHRKTAAMTCHDIGKSFISARIAGHWLDIHEPGDACVVTTAPTGPQVKLILWKEIGRMHQHGQLRGRLNQTEWVEKVGDKEETVALGRKPSDYSPTAFQGIHAPFVLVIVDEANGVRGKLWDAMDSLIANDGSKMLAIFNPDEPSGEIYEACRPNSGWNIVQISAFDSPNFTDEKNDLPQEVLSQLIGMSYVEEKRKKWAPSWKWNEAHNRVLMPEDGKLEDTHPFWQSKVLGQFPVQTGAGSLIPLTWIRQAQERSIRPGLPNNLGLDVGASEDGDPSCLGWRRGSHFRVLYEERQPDTMKTLGRMVKTLRDPHMGATFCNVDYIGVGRGVVDKALEDKLPIIPVSVSHSAKNPLEFADLLSEIWWGIRGLFERGEIDIDENDTDLAEELLMVRWEPNSKGQTKVFYQDGPSPNRADSLLISFAEVTPDIAKGIPEGLLKISNWTSFGSVSDRSRSRWRV
jgi:hypothetical protein